MPTPSAEFETEIRRPADANGRGLGAAVKDVTEHAKALVELELELASLELKRKAAELGVGTGLLVGAPWASPSPPSRPRSRRSSRRGRRCSS